MEQNQKNYLRKWKEHLEQENKELQEQYDSIHNEIIELRTKKNILTKIILRHGDSPMTEDFKIQSNYHLITSDLQKLESKLVEIEPKMR